MSEYEEQSVEEVKDILKVGWCLERADIDNIETILQLVDKQQKEIEEKCKKYVDLCFEAGKIKADLDIAERVIDKMVETFEAGLLYFKKCKNCENYTAVTYDTLKCRNCIKEHFYKEIEDE